MNKHFIDANQLLADSFRLAHKVCADGFRPDFIVGIWRGGAPIGIAVQEYFEFRGINTDHIAVRTSSYYGINQQSREIRVHGLPYIVEHANSDDRILIVDDVFDSGRSVEALLARLSELMRLNLPSEIRIATPWYKPKNNTTQITPDYYIHQTDNWLVFPHELSGLTQQELRAGKPELASVFDLLNPSTDS